MTDGIFNLNDDNSESFFDRRFRVMMHSSDKPSAHAAFYAQQNEAVQKRFDSARLVLDVGCGPRLAYKRPSQGCVIGLDASYDSLRHNKDADLRLYGSATAIPLSSQSIDAVVCFYSLHHLVGNTISANEKLVHAAFQEFARVLKRGGTLLVFEVEPWRAAWAMQRASWGLAKWIFPEATVVFFWRREQLAQIAAQYLPSGTTLERQSFNVSRWTTFAPAFALQWLRVPRFLYPFEICMYHWRLSSTSAGGSE